jgi:ectoine hydroxylase
MLEAEVQPGVLSDRERFIFESWGYLIIRDVLSAAEVEDCLAASRRVHAAAGTVGWGQVGRGYESEPALERLIDHPGVLPKVRGLYGDRFILQSGWNTMQPAHGKMGGWHQDGSSAYDFYKLGYPIPLLQLRASYLLTDQSRPGMGNMELIPGSHRSMVRLPDTARTGDDVPGISHVICAPAGAVLLFHNAVWHRAYEHLGDYDRYTMHMIYSPPWVRASDRLANSQEFLERTTPLRRALMGEYARPDAPFGANYPALPFEE